MQPKLMKQLVKQARCLGTLMQVIDSTVNTYTNMALENLKIMN